MLGKKKGKVVLLAMCLILGLTQCGYHKDNSIVLKNSAGEPSSTGESAALEENKEKEKTTMKESTTKELANEELTLEAALEKAKNYIDAITVNSSVNNPQKVVSTWGRYFTWDNEKREDGKAYLYEWSYYNSVVFEGIDDIYDVTGEKIYADYVEEYLSNMIEPDGSWTMLEKGPAAGYNKEHGLDCYKTASLLLDYYDITKDNRYLVKAQELYKDLIDAKAEYTNENIGGNYYHTWKEKPEYAVWLDGIYMAQPFMAEYAARYDKAELENIFKRFTWVSENMYNSSNGLFFHAANADNNSGGYWLRSIGWYIAAMADVMEYMEGSNLEAMKGQLKKLVDGMVAYQDSRTGMWSNYVVGKADLENNRLETSGTSLMVYGIMKAVNNGWLEDSYTDMALKGFKGMCQNEIKGSNLTAICFKGAPGSKNATFFDNEGKGVGPFIMAYAEVLRYTR